jgi:uncharacterized membrane protein (DUF4010 family)
MAEPAGDEGGIAMPTVARAVGLAGIVNTVVKGGIAPSTDATSLRRALLPPFLVMLVTAAAFALFLI